MAVVEHRFRVMASEAQLLLVDPTPDAAARGVGRLQELEQRWSRFVPESDISRLAGARGAPLRVAPDTCVLLEAMGQAHRGTGGRFDPTMLREIVDVGYLEDVENTAHRSVTIDLPHPTATIDDVEIDGCMVRLPVGMAIDPGGIGKGLAADIVASELVHSGAAGALVCIGGDLSAVGEPPTADGWIVIVEDPFEPGTDLLTVAIDAGGVATSSTLSRSWRQGGRLRHHQLDPRTGTSSDTDLAAATVIAPSAWEAEAHATAAILRGSTGAIDHLHEHGLSGVAISLDGTSRATADLGGVNPPTEEPTS